jgi:hypothetical protein
VGFVWEYLGAGGRAAGRSELFRERQAAEDWMGGAWEELLARGVEEVALVDLDRDRRVYRMGLREEFSS